MVSDDNSLLSNDIHVDESTKEVLGTVDTVAQKEEANVNIRSDEGDRLSQSEKPAPSKDERANSMSRLAFLCITF